MIKNIILDVGRVLVAWQPKQKMKEWGYSEETIAELSKALFDSGVWLEADRGAMTDDEFLTYAISHAPAYEKEIRYFWEHVNEAIWQLPYTMEWIRAMKKAGIERETAKYLASAIKAWNFAIDPKHRVISWLRLKGKMICYMENPQLYGKHLLKAGANLFILTGDKTYLEPVINESKQIERTFAEDFHKWSALSWMTLELFPVKELEPFRCEYRETILKNADKMLFDQEEAYPYRTLWLAHNAGWVHTMSWGNYHPLRRAITLIAAHKLTGDAKYLTGAYLANDFHNGANPLGRSMTSGLGKIYPAAFLDLISYADKQSEFVPGITPYGNTFGIDRNAVKMIYGEDADELPIFRRYVNLEFLSVPSSEYSVWETISPAAVTTGYLIEKPILPPQELKKRKPADDFRKLSGYQALP